MYTPAYSPQKGGLDSQAPRYLSQHNTPQKHEAQNTNQKKYNPTLISDKTFTDPIYPGSNNVQPFNRPYSPIRKKNEVSAKIGSPEHLQALSGEKGVRSPPREGLDSQKHQRWGSLNRQALKFEENHETSKTMNKGQPETTNVRPSTATENRASKQPEPTTKQSNQAVAQSRNAPSYYLPKTHFDYGRPATATGGSNNAMLRINLEPSKNQSNPTDYSLEERNYSQNIKSVYSSPQRLTSPQKQSANEGFPGKTAETVTSPKLLEEAPQQIKIELEGQKHQAPEANVEKVDSASMQGTRTPQRVDEVRSPTSQKDSDVSSTASDALLCDPCVNDVLAKRKQRCAGSHAQADKEFYAQRGRDLTAQLQEQELRQMTLDARKREASLHNKRAGEEQKAKLREMKQREQEEYRNQCKGVERAAAEALENQLERQNKYRQELLGQIEEKQRSPPRKSSQEAEATSLLLRGNYNIVGVDTELKNALLSQIKEKQERAAQEKLNRSAINKQESENLNIQAEQTQLRAEAQELLRREEFRKAIQDGLNAAQRRREHASAEKLKDREELQRSMGDYIYNQDAINRRRQAEMEAHRDFLLKQIDEKRRSSSPQRQSPEENLSFYKTFTSGYEDNEAKNQLRDFLLAQIEEQKRRKSQERMPSNEATGLNFFGRYYAAGGIPPNELRDQLLAQINEKEALKAKNREDELNEARESMRLQEQKRDETWRRSVEAEARKRDELRRSHDEMIERKARSRNDEKMQLKNEEYAPVGTYSHHWNPMMLSPNQLRDELLGQINEKQRQAEALRNEIKAQNEQIERDLAIQSELRQRAAEEANNLRRQDLRDTLLSQIAQKNQERENQRSQKKDQQIEREVTQSNGFESYHRALEQERNKMSEYRDDLLKQISQSPERIGKIADGNTSLSMPGAGQRLYDSEQLRKDLLDQISQKNREKEEARLRDLHEYNKNLEIMEKNSEEAYKKKLVTDKQKMMAVMNELAEYRARKQKEKETQEKQRELNKLGNKDYMNSMQKAHQEAAERSYLMKKELSDVLNQQIQEKSATKLAEKQQYKVSASTSLATRCADSDLTDCDRCHRPYERSKLTNKKSLQLKRKC